MSTDLLVSNPLRTLRCSCIECALFRDNVQHRLESGLPSERFPTIHAIADAPWSGAALSVRADALSSELDIAWSEIHCLPIGLLAISIRTRALMMAQPMPPPIRGTVLLRLVRWPVPLPLEGCRSLHDVFGGLVCELHRLARETPWRGSLVVQPYDCS